MQSQRAERQARAQTDPLLSDDSADATGRPRWVYGECEVNKRSGVLVPWTQRRKRPQSNAGAESVGMNSPPPPPPPPAGAVQSRAAPASRSTPAHITAALERERAKVMLPTQLWRSQIQSQWWSHRSVIGVFACLDCTLFPIDTPCVIPT